MPRARPDIRSLVGGVVVIALGLLLMLDGENVLELRFAALGPVACGAVGTILLAAGLTRPR